jgi:hypothetical protein
MSPLGKIIFGLIIIGLCLYLFLPMMALAGYILVLCGINTDIVAWAAPIIVVILLLYTIFSNLAR